MKIYKYTITQIYIYIYQKILKQLNILQLAKAPSQKRFITKAKNVVILLSSTTFYILFRNKNRFMKGKNSHYPQI